MVGAAKRHEVGRPVVAARVPRTDVMQVEPQPVATMRHGAAMVVLFEHLAPRRRRDGMREPRRGRGEVEDLRVALGAGEVRVFDGAGRLWITHVCVLTGRAVVDGDPETLRRRGRLGRGGVLLHRDQRVARQVGQQHTVVAVRAEPALQAKARQRRAYDLRVPGRQIEAQGHAGAPGQRRGVVRWCVPPSGGGDLPFQYAARAGTRPLGPGRVRVRRGHPRDLAGLGGAQATVAECPGQCRQLAHVFPDGDEVAGLSHAQVEFGLAPRHRDHPFQTNLIACSTAT